MKRICFITTIPGTLRAFILDYTNYIHSIGADREWEIYYLSSPDRREEANFPDFVKFIPVPMVRGMNPLSAVKAILRMRKVFRQYRFDMIQYSTPNASLYASIAGWITGIPVRLYCQWGLAYVGKTGMTRKGLKALEKLTCMLSTWVEPDSKGNLDFAHAEGLYPQDKGSVIWNGSAKGIPIKKFDIAKKNEYNEVIRKKHGIPRDAFVFGFTGRFSRDKGVNELLEAILRIIEDDSSAYLLILGVNETDAGVNKQLLEKAKKRKQIIFCGYSTAIEQYYAAMDCYVLPSYREGFGMTVIEAQAMGTPVIVTDIPGPTNGMIAGVTGLVVPKQDSEALYQAMRDMMNKTETTLTMGKNAHEYAVSNFEQKRLFEEILKDRQRLLESI